MIGPDQACGEVDDRLCEDERLRLGGGAAGSALLGLLGLLETSAAKALAWASSSFHVLRPSCLLE